MRLTVRVRPVEREALSSYLLRLAASNGLELLALWNLIKKPREHFIQMNDLNVLNFIPFNSIDIDKLSELSDISKEELLRCTFLNLLVKFNKKEELERSRFLSSMLRDEFHYCPICIKLKPYYKLIWSVNGIHTCDIHKTSLLNHCVHCNQIIKIKDIRIIDICPKCGAKLTDEKSTKIDQLEEDMQIWLYEFWTTLLIKNNYNIAPDELAIRLLFILNDFELQFDRARIKNKLGDKMKFGVLLQHARRSLSQERVLHISFLIDILYKYNLSVNQFMELEVPIEFMESVTNIKLKKSQEASCLAPWCNKYSSKGCLTKTATSYKLRKDGSELLYYLICPDCGCEYAYNIDGRLIERTNLIQAYWKLMMINYKELSLKELADICGLTIDKLKRCLAYFYSRGLFLEYSKYKYEIDTKIIKKVIEGIKDGESIKDICGWEIWQNNQHFLVYRYHNDVIKQLNNVFIPRGERVDKLQGYQEVERELRYMLDNDANITIANLAERLAVSPETLRLWGCNKIIAHMKNQQKEKRIKERNLFINDKLEAFISEHKECIIMAAELYKALGIERTILWRNSPELTAAIYKRIKEHNEKIREAIM